MNKLVSIALLSVFMLSMNAKSETLKNSTSVLVTTCIAVMEEGKFQATATNLNPLSAQNKAIKNVMAKDKHGHLKYSSLQEQREAVTTFCKEERFENTNRAKNNAV